MCIRDRNKEELFMLHLFVNAEGGLTAAGYALSAGLLVLSLLTGLSLAERGERRGVDARRLAYCAMAVALAYATSFIKVFQLPYGGSVTLLSMLFIVLIANWYGVKTGLLVGFAYGILQFLQEPYVLSLFQVCCDYVLAFAALGLAGLFRGKRNGLLLGYIAAVLARGVFHTLGGYLYWMDYMPETFPQTLRDLYPIVYNYSYLLAEGLLTVIVIKLPAVEKALERIRESAAR
jgi:thiamine transporter